MELITQRYVSNLPEDPHTSGDTLLQHYVNSRLNQLMTSLTAQYEGKILPSHRVSFRENQRNASTECTIVIKLNDQMSFQFRERGPSSRLAFQKTMAKIERTLRLEPETSSQEPLKEAV